MDGYFENVRDEVKNLYHVANNMIGTVERLRDIVAEMGGARLHDREDSFNTEFINNSGDLLQKLTEFGDVIGRINDVNFSDVLSQERPYDLVADIINLVESIDADEDIAEYGAYNSPTHGTVEDVVALLVMQGTRLSDDMSEIERELF